MMNINEIDPILALEIAQQQGVVLSDEQRRLVSKRRFEEKYAALTPAAQEFYGELSARFRPDARDPVDHEAVFEFMDKLQAVVQEWATPKPAKIDIGEVEINNPEALRWRSL